ncbi:MAG: HAD hydrolase-like protein [Azoarcus sp.]|jgi:phosphoglycolate phosphatase|nr:HAD hydrolase-like protein [Azoarcus sp.]
MFAPASIVFDLDGTLIDSAAAILASYRAAFAACSVEPVRAIGADIVGPPINETLRLLTGSDDPALLERLAAAFRQGYDSEGLLETAAYPGIGEMLPVLRAAGRTLYIATNKRIHPTRLIVSRLGWDDHFAAVYALDLFTPRLPGKAAMIGRLLADHGIDAAQAVYVGDRIEDGEASEANGLPFIAATWGYGIPRATEMAARWREAATPRALARMLLERQCAG